jgi:hypothetical protein
MLVIMEYQVKSCQNDCPGSRIYDHCCLKICVYTQSGILKFSTDPNVAPELESNGFVASFMLSVDNDTAWEPIVKASTSRCFDDNIGTNDGFECEIIPKSLKRVIECTYKENFLKCPNYNPSHISECKETYEYWEMCLEDFYDSYLVPT